MTTRDTQQPEPTCLNSGQCRVCVHRVEKNSFVLGRRITYCGEYERLFRWLRGWQHDAIQDRQAQANFCLLADLGRCTEWKGISLEPFAYRSVDAG